MIKLREPANVLVVSPVLPYPLSSGSLVRIHALVRALHRRFSVTLFSFLQGLETDEHVEAVRGICERLVVHRQENTTGFVPRLLHRARFECRHLLDALPAHAYYHNLRSIQDHLQRVVRETRFDAILQEYWYTSLSLARMAPDALRVVDTHDVHFERMALFPHPGLVRWPARDLKRYQELEIGTLRTFHLILALTEGDRGLFARHLDNPIRVVPTGVDMSLFPRREAPRPEPNRIGFFGAVSNPANLDGLLYFYEQIFPRIRERVPDVRLAIIGGHVPPEAEAMARRDPQVHVTGFVPDLQQELGRLQLAVMPLRKTSGIRGRIFEIMAAGVPMVATPAAVRGMSLEAGRHYVEAATPGAFADEVADLLRHPGKARSVVDQARDLVESTYSHQATYDAFCEDLARRLRERR